MQPILFWFRQDLRLAEHRALAAALSTGAPISFAYVFDDTAPGSWPMSGASRWWLGQSLARLSERLEKLGSFLVLRRGETRSELRRLIEETGASAVYCTRCYEPWAAELEATLKADFDKRGIAFKRFGGSLLAEPEDLRTRAGAPFRVYTPFLRALLGHVQLSSPLPVVTKLPSFGRRLKSDRLEAWDLTPSKPDWAQGLRDAWQPGEAGAQQRLHEFIDTALASYHVHRDRPDLEGTSRLSAHLHFGEISPLQCWYAAAQRSGAGSGAQKGTEVFIKELGWREFSYHLLHHWPALPDAPFREEFAAFPWETNQDRLNAWQRGLTGYPIVDAGMRQLWRTGWMHNRVRMVAASFLVKHLLIPWQSGAAWFWDTLVDADLANNSASWQWVAGSGADAAPYFRIFNPVTQGRKFDPDGAYVRRWVPELAQLSSAFLHAPWEADTELLARAGVVLGKTYPHPIVRHDAARARALAGYDLVRGGARAKGS